VRRTFSILLAGAITALTAACGCVRGSERGLTLAGSTSVQPFAEKLAETYMGTHPGVSINVQGGGSTAGVRAAETGAAQIGMSSRHLKGSEESLRGAIGFFQEALRLVPDHIGAQRNLKLARELLRTSRK